MPPVSLFKVVVVGDATVGKTTLIRRFCEGKFHASRVATIGVDFNTKQVLLPGGTVKLSIWDMAGQERFNVVRAGFYRGSRAAALIYDVTSTRSLVNLKRWRDEVLKGAPNQRFIVVGNKVDLERTIQPHIGRALANYFGAHYMETSALSGEGVTTMFQVLARLAANR